MRPDHPPAEPGGGHQGDGSDDRRRRQDLARHEELGGGQEAECDSPPGGASPLAHSQFVQDQEAQGRDDHERQIEMAGALGDLVGTEAVEEPGHEGRWPPGHPAAGEEVAGGSRGRQRQGDEHVERGDRAPYEGHRAGQPAEQQHAGVGEQIHAVGVVGVLGEERIEPVQNRMRSPLEEPHRGELVAADFGHRGRMGTPHRPEEQETEDNVDGDGRGWSHGRRPSSGAVTAFGAVPVRTARLDIPAAARPGVHHRVHWGSAHGRRHANAGRSVGRGARPGPAPLGVHPPGPGVASAVA